MEEDISALQENLLLYADDELLPADKRSVEALLATDKKARGEWAILKQTKLQPDMAVVFADKKSLYRKEGGKIVGFKWWRAAAAAILLGLGLWTGVSIYKNNFKTTTGAGELATGTKKQQQQTKTGVPANSATVTTLVDSNSTPQNMVLTTAEKNNEQQANDNVRSVIEKNNDQNAVATKENTAVQNRNNKKTDNNLPKPSLQNININKSNETITASVLPANNNSNRVSGSNDAVVKLTPKENRTVDENINNSKTDPNITALQAVNKTDEDNNTRYLNVDNDKEKRTALGGFLRKAKRVLERTTNVKAGEGVKIAGFEIALK